MRRACSATPGRDHRRGNCAVHEVGGKLFEDGEGGGFEGVGGGLAEREPSHAVQDTGGDGAGNGVVGGTDGKLLVAAKLMLGSGNHWQAGTDGRGTGLRAAVAATAVRLAVGFSGGRAIVVDVDVALCFDVDVEATAGVRSFARGGRLIAL
jgi:hypothetical protein